MKVTGRAAERTKAESYPEMLLMDCRVVFNTRDADGAALTGNEPAVARERASPPRSSVESMTKWLTAHRGLSREQALQAVRHGAARIAESHRKYLNPAGAAVLSEARTKREAAEAFKRSMRTWAANLRRATT